MMHWFKRRDKICERECMREGCVRRSKFKFDVDNDKRKGNRRVKVSVWLCFTCTEELGNVKDQVRHYPSLAAWLERRPDFARKSRWPW